MMGGICSSVPDIVLSTSRETVAVLEGQASWATSEGESDRWKNLRDQIISEELSVQLTGQLKEGVVFPGNDLGY
jgi:hypothetical protein